MSVTSYDRDGDPILAARRFKDILTDAALFHQFKDYVEVLSSEDATALKVYRSINLFETTEFKHEDLMLQMAHALFGQCQDQRLFMFDDSMIAEMRRELDKQVPRPPSFPPLLLTLSRCRNSIRRPSSTRRMCSSGRFSFLASLSSR